jgi:hypothetical protein
MTSHVVFDQETLQATAAFGYSELDMSVGVHGGSDSTNTDIRLLSTLFGCGGHKDFREILSPHTHMPNNISEQATKAPARVVSTCYMIVSGHVCQRYFKVMLLTFTSALGCKSSPSRTGATIEKSRASCFC